MKKNLPVTHIEKNFSQDANILSTTDLKGAITYVNDDFIDISGFEESELIGNNHNMVRHPDMPPQAFQDLWDTIKSGDSWMGIVKNRCKNGDYYWVNAFVTPIVKDGKVVEYQSIRSKANPEEVKRAEEVYARISAGKTPGWLSRRSFKFSYKLGFTFLFILLSTLAVPLYNQQISLISAALSLIPGALIAMAFFVREVSPLCGIFEKTECLFKNPLARYIFSGRTDEAGQVMLVLKYLEKETGGIIGRIADTSRIMQDHSQKLLETIELNHSSINNQHSETTLVATAITEMSASIQEVAANTQLSADSATQASTEVSNSKQVVNRTMNAIHTMAKEVDQASNVIQQLNENSERISTVVNVISDIAEQTNLLALNAAIEAARAGEQGRGFAVVADEVRTLANRTHESTREIQEMIEQLQNGTANAVNVMKTSQLQADTSVERGQEAVTSLDAIFDAVTNINDMSSQVATAVSEQNSVTQEINQSIVNIQQTSEISVTGITTSEKTSAALSTQARLLKELAAQFWNKRRG